MYTVFACTEKQFRNSEVDYSMKINRSDEEAVSPVIGVILMVAIVVILAAVIAAFVFGMAGNVAPSKSVAATASMNGDEIICTYQGGKELVSELHMKVDGSVTGVTDFSVSSHWLEISNIH